MPEMPILPPIADAPLSVALLARNDADHLESVVGDWSTYLNGLGREYELLLIDDGSSDRTPALTTVLTDRHPRLRILRTAKPEGVGAALATALKAARHPLFFYSRAEPRYRPNHLGRMLQEIDKVHLVVAARGGRPVPWFWRQLGFGSRLFMRVVFSNAPNPLPGWLGWSRHVGGLLARIFFAVRGHDVLCPYRLFRREIFARIPIQSRGAFAHVEILAKANFLGCLIAEEVVLGDVRRPVVPEETVGESFRSIAGEAYRVFSEPDFGPPVVRKKEG